MLENMRTFDDIFGRHKKELEEKEAKTPREQRAPVASSRLASVPAPGELVKPLANAPPGGQSARFKEPTEVLIYGYGLDREGSAIAHYEKISEGCIYEDYDRDEPNSRYSHLLSNSIRASIPRSLPKETIRKINTYQGGEHWIKVTFDSPEAAERACYFSPTVIDGYLVHSELWRGVGPNADAAIPKPDSTEEQAAANGGSVKHRRPVAQGQSRPFSSMPARLHSTPADRGSDTPESTASLSSSTPSGFASGNDIQASSQQIQQRASAPQALALKPLRVAGATRVVLRPATEALLPMPPWSQRTFGHLPLVGALFGGDHNAKPGQAGGMIGNAVPRKEDGTFDWANASIYWKTCWLFDSWLGTDLCGMKGDD